MSGKVPALLHSESESPLVVLDCLRPYGLYSPWNSPGQNTGVCSLPLLQGIFPTQRSNPGPSLQADSSPAEPLGKPPPTPASSYFSSVQFSRSVVSSSLQHHEPAHQASLSITSPQNPPKHKSIESVMPYNHLILCRPLLLLPSIFPII